MANGCVTSHTSWRIGIHGARNAGKTCFLACLYGFRADANGAIVDFTDDSTINYLKEKWDHYLAKGEKPLPNPKGMPADLQCLVKSGKRVWPVSLRDYAGEFVQRQASDDVIELRDETREWLKSCKALLIFIDITEPIESARERLNELNLLLAELHALSADRNTIARPLGIVLTKWDSRPDFDVEIADLDNERKKAQEFLKGHQVFGQVSADLFESGLRVALFPISAFGAHRNDNQPPPGGPRPFNLHNPLLWSVEQAEEMIAEKADREADHFVTGRWSRYSSAIKVLEAARRNNSITKGKIYEHLRQRVHSLRTRLWVRRAKVIISCTIAVFIGLAIGLWSNERSQYASLVRAFGDPSVSPDRIKDQTDRYLARWNPFRTTLGHDSDIRSRWSELQDRELSQAIENLDHFRKAHSSDVDAQERLDQDKRFLSIWGGSTQAASVRQWEAEDSLAAKSYQERIKHEGHYQSLLERVALHAKANKYVEAIAAYRDFLGTHPESDFRSDIESSIEDLEKSRDEFEWRKVVEFDQTNPNSFDETIKIARQYLGDPTAKHKADVESLVNRTEGRWDRALYEEVCNASRGGSDANTLEATQRKATAYLTGTHPHKKMAAVVQQWLNWFGGLQHEQDYHVVVRSMQIPKGSNLEPAFSDPLCRIELIINGRSYQTGWCEGMSPVYGEKLGPYRFKWGQAGTFGVRIEGYRYNKFWNDRAERGPEEVDRFVIGRANGPITVKDRNGTDISINLECDAVRQPSLPPFMDK